jgi:hypothetical protein
MVVDIPLELQVGVGLVVDDKWRWGGTLNVAARAFGVPMGGRRAGTGRAA